MWGLRSKCFGFFPSDAPVSWGFGGVGADNACCVYRRVNPVEKMYAAFPAYLYLNASLAGKMLAPLLEVQDDLTGQAFAAQDIGTRTS